MRNNQPISQREYVLDDEHYLISRKTRRIKAKKTKKAKE